MIYHGYFLHNVHKNIGRIDVATLSLFVHYLEKVIESFQVLSSDGFSRLSFVSPGNWLNDATNFFVRVIRNNLRYVVSLTLYKHHIYVAAKMHRSLVGTRLNFLSHLWECCASLEIMLKMKVNRKI